MLDHIVLMSIFILPCLIYKGTGSPTAPGATHAPITPSPTGSITHAPSPVGIATYVSVGTGYVS